MVGESEARETAVIFGAGPGLGRALAACFAGDGMTVAIVSRNQDRLAEIADSLGPGVHAVAGDATDPAAVENILQAVDTDLGGPDLVVFNAGTFEPGAVVDIAPADFQRTWNIGCFGGFLVAQAAARRMLDRGRGTIVLSGATAALRGSAGFANLAVPKFGLRALSQCLARELGPQGIHVAHVIIDGQIDSPRYRHLAEERGPDSLLLPDDIAASYLALHRQPRSAWTQELDLRPWVERF